MDNYYEYKMGKMNSNYKKFVEKFGSDSYEKITKKYKLDKEKNFFLAYSGMLINKVDSLGQFEQFYDYCLKNTSNKPIESLGCSEITRLLTKFKRQPQLEIVDEYQGDMDDEKDIDAIELSESIQLELKEIKDLLGKMNKIIIENESKNISVSKNPMYLEVKQELTSIKEIVEELKTKFFSRLEERTEKKSTYKQVEEVQNIVRNLENSVNNISISSNSNDIELKKETTRQVVVGLCCGIFALLIGFFISKWRV